VEPIVGIEKIKENFIQWYESAETINHSAAVISAKVFGNEAFAYGSWKVNQIMKDGSKREERGNWSTHNIKVGNNWKMTIDHTNDAEFYAIRNNK
jgi:ketosteroid isomerase-like protein